MELSKQKQIDKTNEAISELVYDKDELQKAYNYYVGKRDPEQYRYLEENFGIGNPTSVEFTPLIKKHVDALIGEYLGFPTVPKISCKDEATVSNIFRDKQLKAKSEVMQYLQSHLSNYLVQIINGKDPRDGAIEQDIEAILRDVDQSFISEYEIAAQNVIQYILQSRQTDFLTKKRQLLQDLLITGMSVYKVGETRSKTNVSFEVLDPLNTFIDLNPESIYIKDSYRVVVRRWMTRTQILNKYGKELTDYEIRQLKDNWKDVGEYKHMGYTTLNELPVIDDRLDDVEDEPGYPESQSYNNRHIPVYEVEWIEVDEKFVMQRYSTVRIGENIFITNGIDKNVIRSMDNPGYCGLSVNGVVFLNRTPKPYSMVLACANLQDKYDLLLYYRDNLIATSGTKGQIIDISTIPTFLGVKWPERVQKALAYRKAGTILIDSTQEGRNDLGASPNQIYNGYDDSIPAQAIQAIQIAIDSVEATVSSITGVFRERLNGIEQRDAVSNIKQGVTNSFIITKPIYQQMDLVTCEMLTDGLNQAKKTWKNGISGTLILGDNQLRVFTALPEHFTITDFDIHIISSSEVAEDMMKLQTLLPDFIKSGAVTPDIIFEIITTKSLTDMKLKVDKALKQAKAENNQLQKLTEQLDQATKQVKKLESELSKAQTEIKNLNAEQIKLEQQKMQLENQVDTYKAQTERTYRENWANIEQQKVDIELAQLRDGNPYNDKVNFDK